MHKMTKNDKKKTHFWWTIMGGANFGDKYIVRRNNTTMCFAGWMQQ